MTEADTKQSQVLNDLASFYASNANFDFTPPSSPVKVTPPTSDSEQEKQPVVVQRNVFISSQDVASRRRRTRPGTKSSATSSMANSNSNLNTAPLSPLAEGDSNEFAGSRRSRRRHGATSTSTSTSAPTTKHESSSNSSSKPSSSTSLQREAPQRTRSNNMEGSTPDKRRSTPDTTIPLQSESGGNNTGSALDKLKRRAASSERSGIPRGSMSSRRGVDESGEMGKSRRGISSDGRRRARRSMAQEGGDPAEPSKDRAAPDRARSNDSLQDMNTSRRGEVRGEGSGEHRRSLPSRSRSNDDVLLEMDISRSGEHRRTAPGRSRSNDDALLVDMDVSRSGEHRRKAPGRSRSNEDVLQVDADEDSRGSGRRRHSRALSDEETPEKPLSATISSSEHSDEMGKASDPPRVRRAAKGTSPLDKLKNATNEVMGEGGGSASKRSGWSGVKHGMDFINKAKAATEENRNTSSRRHDHERRRHRTERQTREVSRSPSRSPERAFGDGPSETPSKKETTASEQVTRSPKKDSDERRRHRSPKRDHKTESSSSLGGHKHSRGRGNSKWSAIKERSVSRGQSADRLDSEDGHERKSTSRPRRSRRSDDNSSSNDPESHKHAATPMSYPSPIAEQPSPIKVSSETVAQAVPEPGLVEASEKPLAEIENSSSKKSSIFKNLLMGKSKSKKTEENPTDAKHQSELSRVAEEKPDQPPLESKEETSSSTQGESEDGDGKPNPPAEASQSKPPEAETMEKPSSDKDLGKKKTSMLKKLLHKSSSHGEEPGVTVEWSRSKPQASKPENVVDDSQKKKSMLKKLLSTGSSKKDGEEGESKKKHSAWGGIKSGMEFTSKLMKVTVDKKQKEKESVDPLENVPDESFKPAKDNAQTPSDSNAAVDNGNNDEPSDGLDYGLMASVASFSADAIEGLDELEIQDTIQEEEDSEDSDDDHDAPASFRSTKSNEVAAVLGAAEDDNVDAFALFAGAMNASSSSLSGTSSRLERPSMTGLRAPSMRLDSGPKVEKPSNRASPSVGMLIEEGDEDEEEESDEEDEESVHAKEPVPIQEEDDEEEEEDNDHDMNDDDEADVSESSAEPVSLLSPLKVMQLSFGALANNAKNSELSVSVHRLMEESKYQEEGINGMCIHGTMGKGVKYDTRSCYSSEEESDFEDDDFAEPVEDGELPVDNDEEEENDVMQDVEKEDNDPDENTLTIVCTVSPEVQLEYLRLQTALEASIVRAKAAREEVRALQLELQARRACFGEVEKRRQQSLKELQIHKVVVKR